MDLSRLLQMLQHEREGQFGLRPISLFRALKQLIKQGSRTRRLIGVQALDRPESLEVRQVLSAVAAVAYSVPMFPVEESPVDDSLRFQDPGITDQQGSLIRTDAISPRLLPDTSVIQLVRDQLSKSFSLPMPSLETSPSDWIAETLITGSVSRVQLGKADLKEDLLVSGREITATEMIVDGAWDPPWSPNSDQLNVSFVIEYSAGPQEVIVETISSTNLQIKVSGLAGTIYEFSGAEFTAQVFYENAVEVLQRVQPNRPVQILFPASTLAGRDRLATIPAESVDARLPTFRETGLSPSVADNQTSPDSQGPLSNSLIPDVGSKITSDESSIDSLIDQVFAVSYLALDRSVLVKLGVSKFQQTLAWPQSDSPPALMRQQEEMTAGAAELRQEPESVASILGAASSQSGLMRLARRGLSWLRPGRLPAANLVSDAVVSEFISSLAAGLTVQPGTELTSQNAPTQAAAWLSWLLRNSSETNQPFSVGTATVVERGEVAPGLVPVFSDSVGNSRDVRGAYSPQAQIRKYREQHRHVGGLNGEICIALYNQDSSRVPRSTSIPRELKYVANPRGPPVYGRDADVPLLEVDAPADLLERLRYSIAPRGPSLAIVETQSPDFTFSSGPSMSPEKVSTDLAI